MATPSLRILVCDDSSLIRKLMVRMLEQEPGLKVIGEAGDGHECLIRILNLKPDLVLLDLEMPVMDGVQGIREARRMGLTTPFLVVSEFAASGEGRTQSALAAGAEGFLVWPHAVMQVERIQPELARRGGSSWRIIRRRWTRWRQDGVWDRRADARFVAEG